MPSRLPPFELELARAATLPAFEYTDPAILAAEKERIFRRSWEPVGSVYDVREPASFLTGEVAGAPIVVTRDASGVLRGFYDVCRHRAGPVAVGRDARESLICRYRGWTYGLDGRLVTTPELGEVKDFDRACNGLRPVRVETWGPWCRALATARAPSSSSTVVLRGAHVTLAARCVPPDNRPAPRGGGGTAEAFDRLARLFIALTTSDPEDYFFRCKRPTSRQKQ